MTGVQTCALPIWSGNLSAAEFRIAELQLLDLASAADNLDEYTQVAQAVYGDVTRAKVEL